MITLVAIVLAVVLLPTPWGIAAVVAGATVDVTQTLVYVRWSRRRRAAVGAEAIVGRRAVAATRLDPRGQVRLDGELWSAVSAEPVENGGSVVVVGVDGITLLVRPEHERGPE